jgi:hypothetical protein
MGSTLGIAITFTGFFGSFSSTAGIATASEEKGGAASVDEQAESVSDARASIGHA